MLLPLKVWDLKIMKLIIVLMVFIIIMSGFFRFGLCYFPLILHIFPLSDNLFDPFPIFFKLLNQFGLLVLLII